MNSQDNIPEFQYIEGPWRFQGGDSKGFEYRIRIEIQPSFLGIFQEFRDGEVCKLGEFPAEMFADILGMLATFYRLISPATFVSSSLN